MKQIFIFSDSKKDNISYFEREPAILVSMSRNDLLFLKEQDFASFPAIYILIGGDRRYVGQVAGQGIAQRLNQHFQKKSNDWVESVLFFARADGKMSKADTDYLERRLIRDFKEKSEYRLMNSTVGNNSYIDKLQKAKSDQLYNIVFEIIDEVANIDLFGAIEDEVRASLSTNDEPFELTFGNEVITAKSARRLFINFVEALMSNEKYSEILKKMVIQGSPTYSLLLGTEVGTYSGRPNSVQLENGLWLFTNLSKKDVLKKIELIAQQLGIKYELKWEKD